MGNLEETLKEIDRIEQENKKYAMFREIKRNQIEQMKKQNAQQREANTRKKEIVTKTGKIALYGGIFALTAFTLIQSYNYYNQPRVILSQDMLSHVGLNEVEGHNADPKLFEAGEIDEMYKYIKENNISYDQIYETIAELCKPKFIDYNFAIVKLYEKYPEIFEEEYLEVKEIQENNKSK